MSFWAKGLKFDSVETLDLVLISGLLNGAAKEKTWNRHNRRKSVHSDAMLDQCEPVTVILLQNNDVHVTAKYATTPNSDVWGLFWVVFGFSNIRKLPKWA